MVVEGGPRRDKGESEGERARGLRKAVRSFRAAWRLRSHAYAHKAERLIG